MYYQIENTNFLHALVVLPSECKKSPRQQDREPCCPMWDLCLTTPECPGFRHHPHERPEFLSPLLLLFLRFIDLSAAPKHWRNASTVFTGMRTGGRAGHSTRLGLVHVLIINWVPRLLPIQCPEFSTDCVIVFAQHGLSEQRVKFLSGGLQKDLLLPRMMCWHWYCKVLPPWIV